MDRERKRCLGGHHNPKRSEEERPTAGFLADVSGCERHDTAIAPRRKPRVTLTMSMPNLHAVLVPLNKPPASPFRLRRRIGPSSRPRSGLGADAMAKVEGRRPLLSSLS